MQMLYRDGRARPSPEQLEAQKKKAELEQEKEVLDYRNRMEVDRSIFSRDQERRSDLHLQLSEKYMIYKDYAERALINPNNIVKGDNRVFYIRPETIFLEDPRVQNAFRNDFMKQISTPPQPEPFTLMADDVHKAMLEDARDKSFPPAIRADMIKFYKRRQYRLQHKRYKYLQRWAHFALTSELVDKVSLKFSPNYSKIQFELENSTKRYQRLEGEDHFATPEKRPQRLEANGDIQRDDLKVEDIPKQSALRLDDLDVYNRIVTYEEKCSRGANKFINKTKWTPLTHRFDVYMRHQEYFQAHREEALEKQKAYAQAVEQRGNHLISHRKLGHVGAQELEQIISAQTHTKRVKKQTGFVREQYADKARYNYELPPMILWNQVDLKVELHDLCIPYGINGDNMENDNGNSFSYNIIVQIFPDRFLEQVLKTQFAYVDSVPTKINPNQLGKKNLRKVLQRNMKKYGKTTGSNTLLELLDIKKSEEQMNIEYINQVEKALFGKFNDGQVEEIPKVRLAKSKWLEWVCFKPELSTEQQQLAAFFSSEKNPLDECACNMMEVLNINDVQNTNLTLESLSQLHYEKLKHGAVKSDFLNFDLAETQSYFSEDQIEFFQVFSNSLKTKSEIGLPTDELENEKIGKNSLYETTQHLLFSHYLLVAIQARESKTKLLYTLNCFRSIQKRVTLDLREFGTRDRVMGDINHVRPMEKQVITKLDDVENEDEPGQMGSGPSFAQLSGKASSAGFQASAAGGSIPMTSAGDIDNLVFDEMVDINRFRYQNKMSNIIYSTCPIIPKFHTTFGEPIDRQEISAEYEQTKDSDPKKGPANKQMGRIDKIWKDEPNDCYIVTDDYGFNVMYDCTFMDMRAVEQEVLKIVSFYINKIEPMQDRDLRNVIPTIDRLGIIRDVLHWEELYQRAKLRLCLHYMECYDHTCDTLEQQRLIQMVVELMARRPRMNLAANHFKDSYRAEIDALETAANILKEFIRMQMDIEYRVNNDIREILEKTYRLIYEQIDNNWQEFPKADLEDEKYKRQLQTMGVGGGDAEAISKLKQIEVEKPGMFSAKKNAVDPIQFAEMLGVPFSSLEMLMKQHHERDPVVKTSLHEHVSFIKIQEGYPIFIYDTAVRANNKVSVNPESTRNIGILDFYESLANLPKIVSSIQNCQAELRGVHKPDNGYMSSALDVVTLQFLHAQLKVIRAEELDNDRITSSKDMDLLTDDSILGNSDKMLFHMKELVATIEDPNLVQNPFVMTKLDLNSINEFPFDEYQKSVQAEKHKDRLASLDKIKSNEGSQGILDTALSEDRSYDDAYMAEMRPDESDEDDVNKKMKMQQASKESKQPRLKQRKLRLNIPSLLEISCNAVEIIRLRGLLIDVLLQRDTLEKVYRDQMKTMAKDGRINFKDCFNFSTFLQGTVEQGRWKNFVDSGPGLKTNHQTTLAINEFDPSLLACLNFSDPEAFKALLCPLGLEEMRLIFRYELVNLNLLITAVRSNQIVLDNLQRHVSELELLCDGYAVSNPVNMLQTELNEQNLKRLPDEKRNATFNISAKAGPFFFNIMNRKARSRDNIEKIFQKCRQAIMKDGGAKIETLLRQMRTARMMLAHDYCEELTGAICQDTLRLELLHETNEMRKRAWLLPKNSMVHKLPPSKNGEHSFQSYNVEDYGQNVLFYDQETKMIQNFWAVPSFTEVFGMDSQWNEFYALNFKKRLYVYDYGNHEKLDAYNKPVRSMFAQNNQSLLVRGYVPKLSPSDLMTADSQVQTRMRLVDFDECYSLTHNTTLNHIYYLRQFQNLFDLELFANKLPSSAYSIAGLEQCVLSGLPFWDEDAEEYDSDDYLANSETNDPMYADQSDAVDQPYRNQLAQKVTKRIAEEKKAKMKLLQEIEQIKDKFTEWGDHMRGLELASDMHKAGNFLNQLVQQFYYSLSLVLMSMQDTHGEKGTALKEMSQIKEVLRVLTHRDDEKVTYTNGFHVNHSVTAASRISLDENVYRPDYDNFFKAVQPVIDEEAMNPMEFTLLSGLYLSRFTNNYSYRKNRRYVGFMPERDYHYLDSKLINIDKDLRKYITSALIGIDSQSKHYACARLNTTDRHYTLNLNLYREVFTERKVFTKQLIRSKILRRALMVLLNKSPPPVERIAMRALHAEFNETFSWKVMTKMDEIERQRQLAATQDQAKRRKLEAMRGDPVKQIQSVIQTQPAHKQKSKKDESILQSYDQATCEVDVYTHEVQSFMIMTGKRLIERETNSLSKCFEMNGKRQQILIHPMQQFASTFDQDVDKKSHLDIVNKVDAVQKMLTQFMNRCLPIETLTSGSGFTISAKDLQECMNDLCRNVVKACEIEMRTRCEQLSMLVLQYENLLYTKDMQLLNLENKLKHAKEELNKIINTKVFSRGNNLIYELDMSTRQLRLMKDNVFLLEKGLKDKIRLYFDKDLQQTRVLLDEQKRKFKEYQLTLNAYVRENVAENINYIDEVMKKRVEAYKDVHNQADAMADGSSQRTLNSHSMNSVQMQAPVHHMMERPNDRRKELLEKYSHLLKKGTNTSEVMDPYAQGSGRTDTHHDNYQVIFEEMERLKESETEARNEVLSLQKFIKQTRMLQRLKEAVQKQKHDYQVDNLKQQNSSNSILWEQLAEAEKREKILKQELQKVQNEVASQDKILDRLRDEMKLEQIEKHKLIQFKNQKVKRLNHLEGMARQMELMQNLNVDKVIQTLTDKDRKLAAAQVKNQESSQFMNEVYRTKAKEVNRVKTMAGKETVLKEVAIAKMEELRAEVDLLQGDQETAYKYMRDEAQKLKRDLKEQTDKNHMLSSKLNSMAQLHQASHHHKSKYDESLFSMQETTEAQSSIRGPNPFLADAQKSYIKKINTEAYLTQEPSTMAMFTISQQNQSLANRGRIKTLADNIVLSAPSKGDINIEVPHIKIAKQLGGRPLLQNLSDANVVNANNMSNLNNRSGDQLQQANSLHATNNMRGARANLSFVSHAARSPDVSRDLQDVYQPYAYQQERQFNTLDVNENSANNVGVLGGPVLAKHDLRKSQQTPKSSVKKAANNKRAQGGVYNSVHLPSLRGQSQTFGQALHETINHEESFEGPAHSSVGKVGKRGKRQLNDSLSHMNKAQLLQANMLLSMQMNKFGVDTPQTLGLGSHALSKVSQSNTALLQANNMHPLHQQIVLKGTQKQLNLQNQTLSPKRSRQPKDFSLMNNSKMHHDAMSTTNSASQTTSKLSARKKQHQKTHEENLFSSLIVKSRKEREPSTIYQQGFELAGPNSSSQKRVVFGKTPKVPGQAENPKMMALVQVSSEENSLDGAANGGISAGGQYSKDISDENRYKTHPDLQQPDTANQELYIEGSRGSEVESHYKTRRYSNMEKDDDNELVTFDVSHNETVRTGQFAAQQQPSTAEKQQDIQPSKEQQEQKDEEDQQQP